MLQTYLNEYIPVSIFIENTGVHDFVFGDVARAILILNHQILIRITPLRIFVQIFHVGVGGRRVQIIIELFAILPVISFMACHTEKTFFKDRINTIPESKGKAEPLVVV